MPAEIPQELTDRELDELERLARAATPGPWRWHDPYTLVTADGAGVLTKRRNRDYVATATPDVLLRLVDEVRFLQRLEQIRAESTAPPRRRTTRPPAAKPRRG